MGLLTTIATLPLAPVRGVVWFADRLAAEAERQMNDDTWIREQLAQLATAYDRGEISAADYDVIEEQLLRQMQQTTRTLDSEDTP